jgi:uncharacterized protein YjbJ (UPF0337 family)
MEKDRVGNVARRARAALREALGKVTGDKRLEAQGAAEKVSAQVRSTAGGIRPGRIPRK